MKRILVTGGEGFIAGHLVKRLKAEGYRVRAVDLKEHEFSQLPSDEFVRGDLRSSDVVQSVVEDIDEICQLAADMGGAGYIFTGDHDADVMHNSATIDLNIPEHGARAEARKFFYSSSACIYPEYNQRDPENPKCSEECAYPAAPDSEYGGDKLFSERRYFAYQCNYKIEVRVARSHNILGPEGAGTGGREKGPPQFAGKLRRPTTMARYGSGFRRNGDHQSTGGYDHQYCRQEDDDPPCSWSDRRSGTQLG